MSRRINNVKIFECVAHSSVSREIDLIIPAVIRASRVLLGEGCAQEAKDAVTRDIAEGGKFQGIVPAMEL